MTNNILWDVGRSSPTILRMFCLHIQARRKRQASIKQSEASRTQDLNVLWQALQPTRLVLVSKYCPDSWPDCNVKQHLNLSILTGAECVARIGKVNPYFHMNSPAHSPHDCELSIICLCYLQGHNDLPEDPMSQTVLLAVGTSFGAFLILSLCAGTSGLAASADAAAYTYLL
jgi:hypothetical protein